MTDEVAVTAYPAWQAAIRAAQSEQQAIDARWQAEQQQKQDAETAAEIADWTKKFNRVLAYLGMPQVATGRIAVVDELEFGLDSFNSRDGGDWYFEVGIRPAHYPETEAGITGEYGEEFRWYHELPNVEVSTNGWRSTTNADRQRSLRAEVASGIDTMTTAFTTAKQKHEAWQTAHKERMAREAESPVQKAPTLEEKLTGALRELVREVLEEERIASGEY